MTISLRNVSFLILVLSVISYPINYSVGGMRILDMLFFLILLVSLPFVSLRRSNLLLVSLFVFVFLLSILFGFVLVGNFNVERLIFIYKYFYPFILILILYNLNLDLARLTTLLKFMFTSHIILVLWVFIYIYLFSVGQLTGSFRPSFPFSNDYVTSDAHLYSSVLAIGTLFFTMCFKHINSSKILFLIFSILSLTAMLLTGSRTGLLVYIIGMSMYLVFIKKRLLSVISILIFAFSLLSLFIIYFDMQIPDEFIRVIDRVTSTDFSNDASFLSRINKLGIGVADSEKMYFVFGTGVLHSSLIWYDSLIGVLMSHFGLLGLVVFFLILYKLRENTVNFASKNNEKAAICTILLVCYILANLITEYFLLSRSVFPILVYLSILHQYIKIEHSKNINYKSIILK